MAEYEDIVKALRNAHAAGDTAAAQRLAKMARAAQKPASGNQPRQAAQTQEGGIGNTLGDMAKATGAGLARGAAGLADLPQTMLNLGASAGSGTAEMLGLASPEEAQAAQALVSGLGPARTGQTQSAPELLSQATGGASDFRGETTAGQFAGTVGEFLPGSTYGGGSAVRNAMAYGVAPGLASEAAGQATEGMAMEPVARTVAAMATGGPAGMASRPKGQKAPTNDTLKQLADDLYEQGKNRAPAPAGAADQLWARVTRRLQNEGLVTPTGRNIAPPASRQFVDVLEDYKGQPVPPREMQNLRQYLNDAQKSTDAGDRRIAGILKSELDDWTGQYVPEFKRANEIYGRLKRSEDVDFRVEKAERRAESTGTGGNRVNSARQNIRQILDNPKARRGYSKDEIKAMEGFVRGDRTTNTLRLISRLSPGSGGLPLALNALAGGGAIASANPLLMAPAVGGAFAQGASEMLTNRQLNSLSDMIRAGAPIPRNPAIGPDRGALAGLMARSMSNAGD